MINPLYTPGSVQQRTKPNKMQGRNVTSAPQSSAQKPLSKSTNESVTAQTSLAGSSVLLDIGTDKRNNRPTNTHKKHRGGPATNLGADVQETSSTSDQQSGTFSTDTITVTSN